MRSKLNLKNLTQALLTTSVVCAMSLSAFAQNKAGTNSGGGGDPTEIKFKEVAQNIKDWIMVGNSASLQLPPNLTLQKYDGAMLTVLQNYNITMTTNKVTFDNQEKTCKSEFKKKLGQITCNIPRFLLAEKDPKQLYQLVHHELATLAGVEIAKGAVSDYEISNQITSLLAAETVYRLPVVRTDLNQNNGEYGFIVWPEVVDQNMTQIQYCPTVDDNGVVTVSDKCLSIYKDLQGLRFNSKSRYNHPVRPGVYKLVAQVSEFSNLHPLAVKFEVKATMATQLPASRLNLGRATDSGNLGSSNYELLYDMADPSVRRSIINDLVRSPNPDLIHNLIIPSVNKPETFNSSGAYYYQFCRFVVSENKFSSDKIEICKSALATLKLSDADYFKICNDLSLNKIVTVNFRRDLSSYMFLRNAEQDPTGFREHVRKIQRTYSEARSIFDKYQKEIKSEEEYEVYSEIGLSLDETEVFAFQKLTNGQSALVIPGKYKLSVKNESGDSNTRDVMVNSPEMNF